MTTPKPDFTMRELLEEMAGIDQDIDLGESLTTREFMGLLGLGSMKTTRKRIRPLVESGILVVTRVQRKNMAGFDSSVPAYAVDPTATWEEAEELL